MLKTLEPGPAGRIDKSWTGVSGSNHKTVCDSDFIELPRPVKGKVAWLLDPACRTITAGIGCLEIALDVLNGKVTDETTFLCIVTRIVARAVTPLTASSYPKLAFVDPE